DRSGQRAWQVSVYGRTRREIYRIIADDAAEIRSCCRQGGFGGQKLCLTRRELRFRLGNVRASDFTDVEPVAGLLESLFENANVAPLNLHDGSIAQIIHIDRGGRQQDGLDEHAQCLAGTRYL